MIICPLFSGLSENTFNRFSSDSMNSFSSMIGGANSLSKQLFFLSNNSKIWFSSSGLSQPGLAHITPRSPAILERSGKIVRVQRFVRAFSYDLAVDQGQVL